jgi:hypothetical protein
MKPDQPFIFDNRLNLVVSGGEVINVSAGQFGHRARSLLDFARQGRIPAL